ncbi:hypothetical protein R5M92_12765 [Halomonas sp. Bachu 37]|uniref:hypothetical protein n=1 Tax=Halomonas kashgarensis TaxID=3084920 RepID=UPI0032170A5F
MNQIKKPMEDIVKFAESYEDFYEVEISVMMRRKRGEKIMFIRMQSALGYQGVPCRENYQESREGHDWF